MVTSSVQSGAKSKFFAFHFASTYNFNGTIYIVMGTPFLSIHLNVAWNMILQLEGSRYHMELFVSKLVSSIIQIFLFSLLPLFWWLITARKKENFFHWIGLKRVELDKVFVNVFMFVAFSFLALSIAMLIMMRGVEMATSEFLGLGISALPAAFVYSVFNTALSEEILFRGFILKRFSAHFGFSAANLIQSMLFGILHGILFFGMIGMLKSIVITVFTALIGWYMGYINEKKASGSILPSWAIHSIANLFSSIMALFSIFN